MTIEQKAKAYDEALERARKFYNDEQTRVGLTPIDLESIFPELKESEDEKISKEIIKYLEQTVPHHHRDEVLKSKEWIAWLEKQETLYTKRDVDDAYLKGISDAKNELEKQGEQKPWSEEDEKVWKELIEEVKDQLDSVPSPDCRDKEDEKALKQLTKWSVWLKSLKERYTWKPSDEQIEILDMVLTNESMDDNIARILRELREQLKKLKGK